MQTINAAARSLHPRAESEGHVEPFSPHTFLSRLVDPMTAAIVTGDDSFPLTHSTSGIMCAGEKKCIPITLAGLSHRHKGSEAHKKLGLKRLLRGKKNYMSTIDSHITKNKTDF